MTDHSNERTEASSLTAGVARQDITPDLGRAFQGYVRPDLRADGVAIRPFARALVLADETAKVALVSADLLFGIDKEAVLERVRQLGFSRDTVLYLGTHTHSSTDAGEWTADRIASAIEAADAKREPAVAGWASATVDRANRSRSVEAHLANHGLDIPPGEGDEAVDPDGPEHPRETTLQLLRVDTTDGEPIAAWAQFPVHPTAFSPHNTLFSADLSGAALRRFRNRVEGPVPLFANRASGDLIPIYDAYTDYAVAETVGDRIADGMVEAWERAEFELTALSVAGRARTVEYAGQEVEPGKRVASRSLFGLPFLAGGENGPTFFSGLNLEGRRRPARLADAVHGRKIPFAPAPWSSDVQVQVVRIGDQFLLGVPGEPTVEMGRRAEQAVCEAVAEALADGAGTTDGHPASKPTGQATTGDYDATVLGLTNGYNGYFTTPEEYDQQHYEGGHTTFGKHSEALLRVTFADLARDLVSNPDRDTTASAGTETRSRQTRPKRLVDIPSTGSLALGPTGPVERFSVVTVVWEGAGKGSDRPLEEPFVRLERRAEGWETVATDLDLGFVWRVDGTRYTARYELPADIPVGEYRLRVTSAGATSDSPGGYDLRTDPFEVVPASTLRIRGVVQASELDTATDLVDEDAEQTVLVVLAQHPPPDPDQHLRSRPVSPTGGTVTFVHAGTEHTAEWDSDVGGWVSTDVDLPEETPRTVSAVRLEDGHGNHSGEGETHTIGQRADLDWPPAMEAGGGRPPAPFDIATWPWRDQRRVRDWSSLE